MANKLNLVGQQERFQRSRLHFDATTNLWNKKTSDHRLLAVIQKVAFVVVTILFVAPFEAARNGLFAIRNCGVRIANKIHSRFFEKKKVEDLTVTKSTVESKSSADNKQDKKTEELKPQEKPKEKPDEHPDDKKPDEQKKDPVLGVPLKERCVRLYDTTCENLEWMHDEIGTQLTRSGELACALGEWVGEKTEWAKNQLGYGAAYLYDKAGQGAERVAENAVWTYRNPRLAVSCIRESAANIYNTIGNYYTRFSEKFLILDEIG